MLPSMFFPSMDSVVLVSMRLHNSNMHKSNIFYYYENKESLYVEVLTNVLQNGSHLYKSLEVELEPTEALD